MLAMRKVRQPSASKAEYPESNDSVLVWYPQTGEVRAYPLAADAISWRWGRVFAHSGALTCTLDPEHGPDLSRWKQGIEFSPDNHYSMDPGGPGPCLVWYPNGNATRNLLRKVGGAAVQDRPRPFWISGAKHVLCAGILDEKDPNKMYNAKRPVWRTVFVDAERMRVVRTIHGRLVAPTADRSRAVVRVGDRFEFVSVTEPNPKGAHQ
jgi:hypothetical protein